jgi:hypothetical protein
MGMRLPRGVIVGTAVVMALPFGWGLGVVAAYLVAGKDFGQLPVATVPLGVVAAITFAVSPIVEARTRLKIIVAGTLLFIVFAWLAA